VTSKRRGRPVGKIGQMRETLKNPPEHISKRIAARGGKTSQTHIDLLANMDQHARDVESYRRSLRAKREVAEVLLSSEVDVSREQIETAAQSLHSWKSISEKAQTKRLENQKNWMNHVKSLLSNYANHSALQAAKLLRKKLIGADNEKPSVRTIRRFIGAQRK
jgi:hypothetical protein